MWETRGQGRREDMSVEEKRVERRKRKKKRESRD